MRGKFSLTLWMKLVALGFASIITLCIAIPAFNILLRLLGGAYNDTSVIGSDGAQAILESAVIVMNYVFVPFVWAVFGTLVSGSENSRPMPFLTMSFVLGFVCVGLILVSGWGSLLYSALSPYFYGDAAILSDKTGYLFLSAGLSGLVIVPFALVLAATAARLYVPGIVPDLDEND